MASPPKVSLQILSVSMMHCLSHSWDVVTYLKQHCRFMRVHSPNTVKSENYLMSEASGGHKFSKLDLADAYLQILLYEKSADLVVINTHQGLYKYKHLPFGFSCALADFQKLMEQIVDDIPGVACNLDDIVVTGKCEQEHLTNLQKTTECLDTTRLRLKPDKCYFFQDSITYLGQIVDKEGVRPHPDKIKAIAEMPEPKQNSVLS